MASGGTRLVLSREREILDRFRAALGADGTQLPCWCCAPAADRCERRGQVAGRACGGLRSASAASA